MASTGDAPLTEASCNREVLLAPVAAFSSCSLAYRGEQSIGFGALLVPVAAFSSCSLANRGEQFCNHSGFGAQEKDGDDDEEELGDKLRTVNRVLPRRKGSRPSWGAVEFKFPVAASRRRYYNASL